ncbi:hypothetical protein ACRQ5B_15280 [Pseudarthrobacter sp. L19]|uniref:hypothetical protein n=1 Tax=Pseudarthrobacter sp. L19 TaxID=3423951 RepID=UPI003D7A033A
MLATEVRNYTDIERRLANAPGRVLLSASSAANGPSVGFREDALIQDPGAYIFTMACVGIPYAQIRLTEQVVGGKRDKIFEVDCSATRIEIVQLQAGHVIARLIRYDPAGPWTGAVAGIRVSAP